MTLGKLRELINVGLKGMPDNLSVEVKDNDEDDVSGHFKTVPVSYLSYTWDEKEERWKVMLQI